MKLSHRWLVLSVFVLSSTINYLDRQTLATLAPVLLSELRLSNAEYGWIVSAFSITYAACAPFAGLLIDRIGEVLQLHASARENVPINLDSRLARVAAGVHRLESGLMVVLDVDHVLEFGACAKSKVN